jgi:hypothetical protein
MMETSSTSARSKVKQLLEEAQVACHRPLFEEVELAPTTQRSCEDEPFAKRFKRGQRSWEMVSCEKVYICNLAYQPFRSVCNFADSCRGF